IPVCFIVFITVSLLPMPVTWRFALRNVRGASLLLAVACFGLLLMQCADARRYPDWIGHHAKDTCRLIAVLQEPPVKKANSWKAEVEITALVHDEKMQRVRGRAFFYFREEPSLQYGD